MPPVGVYFSGWNAATVGSGIEAGDLPPPERRPQEVELRHDVRKRARRLRRHGGAGLFTRVVWNQGTTEGGSSGGGLVTFDFGDGYFLRGALLGGDALCSNPTGSRLLPVWLDAAACAPVPDAGQPGGSSSVEHYHANPDYYFMTIDLNETRPSTRARSSAGSAPASVSWRTTRRARAGTPSAASTASRRSAIRTSSPRTRRNARVSRSTTRPTGISKARRSTTSRSRMRSRAPARPGPSRSTDS
jgi:hypothetical protein